MVTKQELLDIALEAEGKRDRKTQHEAMACALWMERHGLEEIQAVGPFGEPFSLRRGSKVKVRKGAKILTTHPSTAPGERKEAGRAYQVTIHRYAEGYVLPESSLLHARENLKDLADLVRNPHVVWAGTGGYWCEADLEDVEVVGAK